MNFRFLKENYLIQILLVFYSPVIGNAISFEWFEDYRRIVQLVVLLTGLGLFLSGVHYRALVKNFKSVFFKKSNGIVLILASVFLVSLFFLRPQHEFGIHAIVKVSAFLILLIPLFTLVSNHLSNRQYPNIKKDILNRFNLFAFFLGILLFLKAWFYGPSKNNSFIDFSGSYIMLGMSSSLVYFMIIYLNQNKRAVLLAMPYLYLSFFSTSRTGYVIFSLLFTLFIIKNLIEMLKGDRFYKLKKLSVLAMMLCAIASMFSFNLKSSFFPYLVRESQNSALSVKKLIDRRVQDTHWRFMRIPMVFMDVKKIDKVSAKVKEKIINRVQESLPKNILQANLRRPSRVDIYIATLETVKENPWGNWPEMFRGKMQLETGYGPRNSDSGLHAYPHNLILETGYYWGHLSMLFFAFLILVAAFDSIKKILTLKSLNSALPLSLISLTYILAMQITGTFYDYILFILIIIIFFLHPKLRHYD